MRSDVDFDTLVEHHHAALFRFALSMTRNEADACDLVQETFLRWAQKGHQLKDPAKARTWLFTTLHREASGQRRRLLRFPNEPIEEREPELPEVPPGGEAIADGATVLAALSEVDEAFRAALALFYLEDHTHPEIAEILDIPLGTVKSRIARGMAQLQRRLHPTPASTLPGPKPGATPSPHAEPPVSRAPHNPIPGT